MSLPPELWQHTFAHLPVADLKVASLASRFYRSVAAPFLFHAIDIWFGVWYPERFQGLVERDVAEEDRQARRSLAILLHIVEEPGFAQLITRLRVFAMLQPEYPLVFESCKSFIPLLSVHIPTREI